MFAHFFEHIIKETEIIINITMIPMLHFCNPFPMRMDDSDFDYYDDSTSFDSEDFDEPSYEETSIVYRRQTRLEPDFDDVTSVNSTYEN
jgi:hypothetical protein